ncbi:hypothetical protein ONS95_001271 [Cadophora gregata]|uniref:uncharacterized protein n=1 Tax=Cadophora gregata TaxID=51156 RepID=UPI0026DCAA64|nr:uncharacterized protein ONS95_001271 [Cadophora gregata]KAK0129342.1 hypothetical protein ONS95_001271 [Cadophora gregata]
MGSVSAPKIILYTNHRCPWAHRAHIALAELGLEYKEEIIDLSVPRTAEYLKVNPRGLVPSINYNGNIVTESAIVAQFLADAHPSHLVKTSSEEGGALQRARIAYFVDAYFSKVNGGFWGLLFAEGEEKEKAGQVFVDAVVKEIEPLLQDAAPFFGGSRKLTLAEVFSLLLFSPSYLPECIFLFSSKKRLITFRSKLAPSSSESCICQSLKNTISYLRAF